VRWGRQSDNIEDRRGGGGIPIAVAGGGLGTIVLLVLALFFGVDPGVILRGDQEPSAPSSEAPSASPRNDPARDFVAMVLADTEDTWGELFRRMNRDYRRPKLVLFTGAVQSACGMAAAAVGPFYCAADQKVYLDLEFLNALQERFRAPGDFAQAYVIAHEVGHHVQTLLGLSSRNAPGVDRHDQNEFSVRRELQADCLAGVWAHHADAARGVLEAGDVEEALGAAAAVGDDRLQREAGRRVAPETFTHGTSAQRVRWFRRGLERGDLRGCETFAAAEL
jgi:predicted metalloprotease